MRKRDIHSVKYEPEKRTKSFIQQTPSDKIKNTPLIRLLAMAYIYEQRLKENSCISQREFCELNNISPRYLRGILQLNLLSPTIKQKIIN